VTDDPKLDQEDESTVGWPILVVIVVIFLCFTIIPALIFFMDRGGPELR
jgi:hypothetical protein